jgi:hypothetical protein
LPCDLATFTFAEAQGWLWAGPVLSRPIPRDEHGCGKSSWPPCWLPSWPTRACNRTPEHHASLNNTFLLCTQTPPPVWLFEVSTTCSNRDPLFALYFEGQHWVQLVRLSLG